MEAKAIRGTAVLLFWTTAALLVLAVHRTLDTSSPTAATAAKVIAIIGVAFAYVRLTAREVSLDHALAVGVAWLAFNIACEVTAAAVAGHGWYELIGLPSNPAVRNLLMITWLAAPAMFARIRSDE
jgi:hypothetical protein